MAEQPDAFDLGLLLARALEGAGLPYAIGGALAYGRYGVPRATHDVDINVFVELSRAGDVLATLTAAGVTFDRASALRDAQERGMMVGHSHGMRVDVFLPSIDFSWEASRTRQPVPIGGEQIWFLSAEALCVFKLLFYRSKDIVDLERLVATRPSLDRAYVRDQISKAMGEDDPRTQTWDRLVREFGAP
jgi:hypothetical protein